MPVVQTYGGRSVYGHVITKFSEMGRFTYPWYSPGARESSAVTSLLPKTAIFGGCGYIVTMKIVNFSGVFRGRGER